MWTDRRLATDENAYGSRSAEVSKSHLLQPGQHKPALGRKALGSVSKNTPIAHPSFSKPSASGGKAFGKSEGTAPTVSGGKPRRALGEITNRVKSHAPSSGPSGLMSGKPQGTVHPFADAPSEPIKKKAVPVLQPLQPKAREVEALSAQMTALDLLHHDDEQSVELCAGRTGDQEDALLARQAQEDEDSVGEVGWDDGFGDWGKATHDYDTLTLQDALVDDDMSGLWEGLDFLRDDDPLPLPNDTTSTGAGKKGYDGRDGGGTLCDIGLLDDDEF